MSAFSFIDEITEIKKNEELTAFFTLKGTEKFLEDHFAGFPVMPGVLLLETMKQAATALLAVSSGFEKPYFRLVKAEEVRFGRFVKPGNKFRVWVRFLGKESGPYSFEGRIDPPLSERGKILSANFTLEPLEVNVKEKTHAKKFSEEFWQAKVQKV